MSAPRPTPSAPSEALPDHQSAYWDRVAPIKRFTHPVPARWVPELRPDARVLDLGCGYGRLSSELLVRGSVRPGRVIGLDASAAMLARARSSTDGARFVRGCAPLPFADWAFDWVLLVSVLTCNPDAEARRALIDEVARVLRPGGSVFVSDLFVQQDDESRERYATGARRFGAGGVFELDEGVVLAHLERRELNELVAAFSSVELEEHDVRTMNGNVRRGFRLWARTVQSPNSSR